MYPKGFQITLVLLMMGISLSFASHPMITDQKTEAKIADLIGTMSLEAKIGQMTQRSGRGGVKWFRDEVRAGKIGSILNEVNVDSLNELQRIAVEESPNGIPLIIGRDVIHGFRTIFPIPLGQAATWNPGLVEKGARIAAVEAASSGVRWTFAPMMDIARDARWGRIAEGFGEDPYLASVLAKAMVRGFQSGDLSNPDAIAACAKHFAGYGAAEGGRDYNTTLIPENELRDVYLKPFQASVDAGCATFMCAFNELNGVPASGNRFLFRQILRDEWQFKGFVVSDWASITQMVPHGFCRDHKHAAEKAVLAGIDMEMQTDSYVAHIRELLDEGKITMQMIDGSVANILRVKFALGLFDNPYTDVSKFPEMANDTHRDAAQEAALQSVVLLQNRNEVLPLSRESKIAVTGPLADAPHDQLGTWAFDGREEDSVTPLQALKSFDGPEVNYVQTLAYSRDKNTSKFEKAVKAAASSDAVLLFMGEEAIITGEAHCRANIDLPGAQNELIEEIHEAGKPIVLVVMAGRPLTIGHLLDKVDAVLYAFHPGTMAGPALVDLIFGDAVPSGKITATFPKVVGQIPIYYNHKNTGRPPNIYSWVPIDSIGIGAWQTSLGNESHYLDAGFKPQFPFGFGLSYTTFAYSNLKLSTDAFKLGESITVSAEVKNAGKVDADEVVQLYIRDLVGDITRPVKELKGFERIHLKSGEKKTVQFELKTEDLAFHNQKMEYVTEPGQFHVWIGPNSTEGLQGEFEIVE